MTYRMPGHLRLLKATLTALVATAGVTVLYVVFWFSVAGMLRDDVTAWAEDRRAKGETVEYANLEMSGFPLWLRATMTSPAYAPRPNRGAWRWQGRTLVAEARPWEWNRITVKVPGAHSLTLPAKGTPVTYQGSARRLEADLAFAGGQPRRVDLRLEQVTLTPEDAGPAFSIEQATLSGHRKADKGAKDGAVSFELRVDGSGLVLPLDAAKMPLGTSVRDIALEADLTGPFPERFDHEALTGWRDAGGTLEVRRLTAAYGPLDLSTNGTLALDEAMQPVGAFTARAQGFFETLDLLAKRGLVRSRDAVTAKLVLSALAKRPEKGGRPSLSVPLTLQNRRLHAGPVPLVTFDPVEWPGTPPSGPKAERKVPRT